MPELKDLARALEGLGSICLAFWGLGVLGFGLGQSSGCYCFKTLGLGALGGFSHFSFVAEDPGLGACRRLIGARALQRL